MLTGWETGRSAAGRLLRAACLTLATVAAWAAGPVPGLVCTARVQGTIGPATAGYLERALAEAARQKAQCLVIELDTPGGLLDSTREIIQTFLRSAVPTVVYVSPPGAWAGSAGCLITMAADVAAMAPSTSIGGGQEDATMKQKLENFTASYIEAIAAKRHRNTEWARQSVRESAFQLIAHPQVMLILMLIVMYGLIGELTSPGAVLPGVAGVIALFLLLYLASVLPINIAGLALVAVATGLFLIDLFAPTHGVLTFGGCLAFFLGTLMLFDRGESWKAVSFEPIEPGQSAEVVSISGLTLRVQPKPGPKEIES